MTPYSAWLEGADEMRDKNNGSPQKINILITKITNVETAGYGSLDPNVRGMGIQPGIGTCEGKVQSGT